MTDQEAAAYVRKLCTLGDYGLMSVALRRAAEALEERGGLRARIRWLSATRLFGEIAFWIVVLVLALSLVLYLTVGRSQDRCEPSALAYSSKLVDI